jgi:hypothetical protein
VLRPEAIRAGLEHPMSAPFHFRRRPLDQYSSPPPRSLRHERHEGRSLNGVPSLSVWDGWWVEGHFEGVTGWSVGFEENPEERATEPASLYEKLEHTILPMFYSQSQAYAQVMRSAIAVNGSFFNTQRMVSQYLLNAYGPEATTLDRQKITGTRREAPC